MVSRSRCYADDVLAHDIYSMTARRPGSRGRGGRRLRQDPARRRPATAGPIARRSFPSCRPERRSRHVLRRARPDLHGRQRRASACAIAMATAAPTATLETWTKLKHPEHGANGIVRGPDGCYYLVCGNDAGISAEHAVLATSPVKQPHSGGIVRFSPDGQTAGRLCPRVSQSVRSRLRRRGACVHGRLRRRARSSPAVVCTDAVVRRRPGTRTRLAAEGLDAIVESARVVLRQHASGRPNLAAARRRAWPRIGIGSFRNTIAAACSPPAGRLGGFTTCRSQPDGASCSGTPETFLETTGDVGFAPCDLAVGPEGDLFVAIGGRRTLGSVFRIRYREAGAMDRGSVVTRSGVLEANQPLASWSRPGWVSVAKYLGAATVRRVCGGRRCDSAASRVRAIEVLVEVFGGVEPETARKIMDTADPAVRARLAWALGRGAAGVDVASMLAELTSDPDSQVRRFAWEALATRERSTRLRNCNPIGPEV